MTPIVPKKNMLAACDVSFTPMSSADIDWVITCEHETETFPWTHVGFANTLSSSYSNWLLYYDGNIVGFAIMMLVLDEAHLLKIAISPSLQGHGLGSLLLDHLFGVARRMNVKFMFLEVRPSNGSARALYHKWGFEMIGRRKDYYPAENGREDALVMRHEL